MRQGGGIYQDGGMCQGGSMDQDGRICQNGSHVSERRDAPGRCNNIWWSKKQVRHMLYFYVNYVKTG